MYLGKSLLVKLIYRISSNKSTRRLLNFERPIYKCGAYWREAFISVWTPKGAGLIRGNRAVHFSLSRKNFFIYHQLTLFLTEVPIL